MPVIVRVEKKHGCAWVTLDRPPLNLIVPELIAELRATFESLARDEGVRAAVVTGAGRAFTAGMQVQVLRDLTPATAKMLITSALVGRSFKLGDQVRIEISPETSVLLPDGAAAA